MGKKRIKIMGGETPKREKTKTGLAGETSRRLVKSGKEHGRITDMGAVALAEAEKIKEKEKELEKLAAKTEKIATQKAQKKAKVIKRKRGKRYLAAKKQIDRTRLYPLNDAIKLVKKTSISRFNGKVEMHLNIRGKGFKRKVVLPHPLGKQTKLEIATEKKTPLIHLVIGRLDTKEFDLSENFQAIIEVVGTKNIKKAVLTSTMGPGIKVDLASI